MRWKIFLTDENREASVELIRAGEREFEFKVDEKKIVLEAKNVNAFGLELTNFCLDVERRQSNHWRVSDGRQSYDMEWRGHAANRAKGALSLKSQMPGKVVRILAKEGEAVKPGQTLLIMEAMKMENEIKSEGVGKLLKIHVKEGENLEAGVLLVELGPDA